MFRRLKGNFIPYGSFANGKRKNFHIEIQTIWLSKAWLRHSVPHYFSLNIEQELLSHQCIEFSKIPRC